MDKITYAELLKDPRWGKRRKVILKRDKYTCQDCGAKNVELHVLHLKYNNREPWTVPLKWLVTLCDKCHNSEHLFREDLQTELIDTLKTQGYLAKHIQWLINGIKNFPNFIK